jgi:hypothetical protein
MSARARRAVSKFELLDITATPSRSSGHSNKNVLALLWLPLEHESRQDRRVCPIRTTERAVAMAKRSSNRLARQGVRASYHA